MSPLNCIFCKIAGKELGAEFLYEDEHVFAIRDINPKSPHHVLIIPFLHIEELVSESLLLLELGGYLLNAAAELARKLNVYESGYRLVINQGPDSGQEVPHLHMHLLAGRPMSGMN